MKKEQEQAERTSIKEDRASKKDWEGGASKAGGPQSQACFKNEKMSDAGDGGGESDTNKMVPWIL